MKEQPAKVAVFVTIAVMTVAAFLLVLVYFVFEAKKLDRLTNSQRIVVEMIAWPESFLLIFSPVQPGEKIEIWNYEKYGSQLVFANGVLAAVKEIKGSVTAGVAIESQPNQFSGEEKLNWFEEKYGKAISVREKDGVQIMRFGEGLVAVFKDKKLLALAAGGLKSGPGKSNELSWSLLNAAHAEADPDTGYRPTGFWDNVKTWLVNRSFLGRTINMLSNRMTERDVENIGNDTIRQEKLDRLVKFRTDDFPEYAVEAGKEAIYETIGKGTNLTNIPYDIGDVSATVNDIKDFVKNYNSDSDPDPRVVAEQIKTKAVQKASGGKINSSQAQEIVKKKKRKSVTYDELMKLIEDDLKMSADRNENVNVSQFQQETNDNSNEKKPENINISGKGSWKGGDCRGSVTMNFPSEGGAVSGSFSGSCYFQGKSVGSCSGSLQGQYSGGAEGIFSGTAKGSCSIMGTSKGGSGSFSGSADLKSGSAKGKFSTHGYLTSWNIKFSPIE